MMGDEDRPAKMRFIESTIFWTIDTQMVKENNPILYKA